MASEEKKQSKKQVFDVAKPGKTPAEASSRPIIVTHKPLVEDPMVSKKTEQTDLTDKPSGEATPSAAGEVVNHGGKIVEPLRNEFEETQDTEEKKPNESYETTSETESNPEPEFQEDAKSETNSETSAEINTAAEELDQAKAKQETDAKASKQEIELQEKVSKLIEEKKYFVKIGETRRHKSTSTGVILLVLLLVIVGLYLAVDAELIKTNFSLPYDFIK